MQVASDIMVPAALTGPDVDLKALARELLAADVEGMCVVDTDGKLVGVVTGMDLVFREKQVQPPTTFALLDLVLQFGARRTVRELEKIGATRVDELMTSEVLVAAPSTTLEKLATMMVDNHVSMVPIVEDGRPVGVVTRRVMIATALRHLLGEHEAG
jgi:CBS domain-containing protein